MLVSVCRLRLSQVINRKKKVAGTRTWKRYDKKIGKDEKRERILSIMDKEQKGLYQSLLRIDRVVRAYS